MHSILSPFSAVLENWFFRKFKIGFSCKTAGVMPETLATTEFPKDSKESIYIKKLNRPLLRQWGVETTLSLKADPMRELQPTCPEEAEALKVARPGWLLAQESLPYGSALEFGRGT